MTFATPTRSQQMAGRIAGIALLTIIVSGVVGSSIGQDHLVVSGDIAASARNILAHERLYRIGVACELLMLNCDVILAVALYTLLKPVHAPLAFLGAFWRLANAIVLSVSAIFSLVALDLLGGAHYLATFQVDQLRSLAKFFIDMHGTGSLIGLVFFSLGAGVHSYVLLRSKYIPRFLSGLYLFATIQLLLCCVGFIVFPRLSDTLGLWFILPDFLAELLVALWLTFKGVSLRQANSMDKFAAQSIS